VIVHGLGEHSGRYGNVVDHLLPLGYACFAFDHIGHGKSEGDREFVQSFEDFTISLTKYIDEVKEWLPNKPIFLLGHSMGGLISSYYLLDHSDAFQGGVISAPLITVPDNITKTTLFAANVLSRIVPKMGLTQVNANYISSDPEVVQAYLSDPLVYNGKTPVRLMSEILKAIIRVQEEMEKISTAVMLIHGGEDRLVPIKGTRSLYERVSSKDKTIKLYDGLYHEVFNEPERKQVLEDVSDWLDEYFQ
jgi:alpha-beta hydrolase superfamily lysophospholipase